MILVDTSVWIDFFGQVTSRQCSILESLIRNNDPVCINGIIEMEIKQGIRGDEQWAIVDRYLKPFQEYPNILKRDLELASEIFRKCRRRGVTVRRSLDCVIAANALSEGIAILHKDRDFDHIAKVYPELLIL